MTEEKKNNDLVLTDEDAEQALINSQNKKDMVKLKDVDDENIKNVLQTYPEEARNALTASKYDVERLKDQLKNIAVDMSIPRLCLGTKCEQASTCPISSIAPLGRNCPIEKIIMAKDIEDYKEALQIDELNRIDMDRIMELVEADIFDRRASADIAIRGMLQNAPIGITESGQVIYKKEKAVALDVKLMYKRRKDKIISDFLATRQAKVKAGLKDYVDPSKFAADLLKRSRASEAQFEEVGDKK